MTYDPATDFLGLWRSSGGSVSKLEMPGLDYVIAALARAGVISVSVSATAPVANQSTTAWLQAAVPSYSGEGAFRLWDKEASVYAAATPRLFMQFLEACANESGASWHTTTGGPPANTVGNNGDYAIRTDGVGGIYGPKTAGAWPLDPLPGTTNTIDQDALDNTFSSATGSLIVRTAVEWEPLPIGAAAQVLAAVAGLPDWTDLTTLLDTVFSNVRGSVLYRGAAAWAALGPGASNTVLTTNGAGADPTWTPKSSEFTSGTVMLFRQTSAPIGWTKQTAIDNYGLRVTSGTVGTTAGSPFSTVFSQSAVGNTTLSTAQMPFHSHSTNANVNAGTASAGGVGATVGINPSVFAVTDGQGGGGAHTHSVNLSLAYVDVIIATKN